MMASQITLIFVLLTTCLVRESLALSCPCWWHEPTPDDPRTYREKYCPRDLQCPPGAKLVPDACYCCEVCSKIENEVCAGPWGVMGECSDGLECINPNTNATVDPSDYTMPMGKCRPVQGGALPLNLSGSGPSPSENEPASTPSPALIGEAATRPSETNRGVPSTTTLITEPAGEEAAVTTGVAGSTGSATRRPRKPKNRGNRNMNRVDKKKKNRGKYEKRDRKTRRRNGKNSLSTEI